ncbi:hypothetical protein CLV70_103185 [Pseudosporangium ferrugineum]|uniref:Uncharacterized protein n=1 Tax=Pseudosporangium ferrugineum TaxID=439699 RepID=A0A2T0SCY5_9ACTN|nr:hypothetical protein CLV70_103185 [Pseudosporangium ferrugineum]
MHRDAKPARRGVRGNGAGVGRPRVRGGCRLAVGNGWVRLGLGLAMGAGRSRAMAGRRLRLGQGWGRLAVGRGPWAVGRGSWVVGGGRLRLEQGCESAGRGPWAVGGGRLRLGQGWVSAGRGPWLGVGWASGRGWKPARLGRWLGPGSGIGAGRRPGGVRKRGAGPAATPDSKAERGSCGVWFRRRPGDQVDRPEAGGRGAGTAGEWLCAGGGGVAVPSAGLGFWGQRPGVIAGVTPLKTEGFVVGSGSVPTTLRCISTLDWPVPPSWMSS